MAYISAGRFSKNAGDAIGRCIHDLRTDEALNSRVGQRLPRMYFHAGILPSRDTDAIAARDAEVDAEMAEFERTSESVVRQNATDDC